MIFIISFTGVAARVPRENHRPVPSHWQTWSHKVVSSTSRHEWDSNSQHQWW
jgi:hypothetical protein